MTNNTAKRGKVCIVGAGAAGLCALRHFIDQLDTFTFSSVVCYEQTNLIGGTWNYTDQVGLDHNGVPIHSSMYRDLSTNLPMQIMEFPDFPWTYRKSYVSHDVVLQYLHDYCTRFQLLPYIRFEHQLISVKCIEKDDKINSTGLWQVTVKDLTSGLVSIDHFEVIVLCLGRHSTPKWPRIDSLSHFKGNVIHSHDYRTPEPYTGQRVAVIGGGPSGIDICLEISAVASEVLLLNRHDFTLKDLPSNIIQFNNGEIDHFDVDTVWVKSKSKEGHQPLQQFKADSVVMATGYRLQFDYIDANCGIGLNAQYDTVEGLYRQLVNIARPTMAVLGVPVRTLPFPLFHQQVRYFVRSLLGQMSLPTPERMKEEVQKDLHKRKDLGFRPQDAHLFNTDLLGDYFQALERDAQLEPRLAPSKLKLFGDLWKIRFDNPIGYKDLNYRIVDADHYEEVHD